MKTFFTIIFLIALLINSIHGQKQIEGFAKITSDSVTSAKLNTNNISTTYYSNGICDVRGGQSGFEFPKGSGKSTIFVSGLLWGAVNEGDSRIKIGGSAWGSALQPGRILPDGTPEDPSLLKNRIYRVRPDVYPGGPYANLSSEIKDEADTYENIRSRYEADWSDWPAEDGAPFVDKDLNGFYDPTIDLPGVKNAAQTIRKESGSKARQ